MSSRPQKNAFFFFQTFLEHPVPPVAEHQTIQFWTTNNQTAGELKCYCLFRHGGQMPERFLCVCLKRMFANSEKKQGLAMH